MKPDGSTERPDIARAAVAAAMAALLLLLAALYARTAQYPFLQGDDASIVTRQPEVMRGLSWHGVAWAFTHLHFGLWMPVTSLSHMLDVSLFGDWAGGHHLSGVLWHMLAVLAFFGAARALTGRRDAAVVAATLFALHPLRVESVAWVAGRKDLTAGLFFALALWAHVRHARRPGVARYSAVFLAGALAMLGKTSAAVLPGVLLLLDIFPLGRYAAQGGEFRLLARRALVLFAEKLPLVVLALVVIALAWRGEKAIGALVSFDEHPPLAGLAAAAAHYLHYLRVFFLPFGLSPAYIDDALAGSAQVTGGGIAIFALVCATALALCRRAPWVTTGWVWFVGALVPVIGLVKFGASPCADRFSYIPSMGLSLAFAWVLTSVPLGRALRVLLYATLALVLASLSWGQVGVWRDTWSLFERKMQVYPDDAPTFSKAGEWLLEKGDAEGAAKCYREAVRIAPDSADNCYNLGSALMERNPEEAAQWLEKAARLNPGDGAAWTNLGCALMNLQRPREALAPLQEGVRLQPKDANARVNLAVALLRAGKREDARAALEQALALDPLNAAARANLESLR
jgi:tetratricopeptide (TPR) repeat protein